MKELILGVLAIGLALFLFKPAAAKDAPLFREGHTYGILLGCVPVDPPCYGEKVKITNIREDGWIEGIDVQRGQPWTYNPAQIVSFMEITEVAKAE